MIPPVIELAAVSKDYHGLRPLRIEKLTLAEGELVAILGLDQPMAETFINLVTGAMLPDRGEVTIFGRPTASIDDSADWLSIVDRYGIVSERAVLLDALSVIQNLSIPFTLDIDPPPDDVRERAVLLGREAGLRQAIGCVRCRNSIQPAVSASARRGRWRWIRKVLLLEHAERRADARRRRGAWSRHSADCVPAWMWAHCRHRGPAVCLRRCQQGADARPGQRPPVRTARQVVLIHRARKQGWLRHNTRVEWRKESSSCV